MCCVVGSHGYAGAIPAHTAVSHRTAVPESPLVSAGWLERAAAYLEAAHVVTCMSCSDVLRASGATHASVSYSSTDLQINGSQGMSHAGAAM